MKVNHSDPRVVKAVSFVEDNFGVRPGEVLWSGATAEDIGKKPWIYFSLSLGECDIRHNLKLLEKYGKTKKDDIRYYLWFHGCHYAVIAYWTFYRVNGIKTSLCCHNGCLQGDYSIIHSYLVMEDGSVIDPLSTYCCSEQMDYTKGKKKIYSTPEKFFVDVLVGEKYLEGNKWAQACLSLLRELAI